MKPIQILVISLKDSQARQAKVTTELAKTPFPWRFLEAVDGRLLDLATVPYPAEKVRRLLGFELTAKEIGCYLSHMRGWQACVAAAVPTLIFEDDFVIEPHFVDAINALLDQPDHWQLVRLQALCESAHTPVLPLGAMQLVQNASDPLGATAYLLQPQAAQQLLAQSTEIYEPLDHYVEHVEKHGLRMLALLPYPVTVVDPTRATSTITDRPDRPPIKGARKLMRSVFRLIDRNFSNNPWFPKTFH